MAARDITALLDPSGTKSLAGAGDVEQEEEEVFEPLSGDSEGSFDSEQFINAVMGIRRRGDSVAGTASRMHKKSSIAIPTAAHASEFIGEASLFSCVMSLSNSVVGAGMLTLPYAVSKMGLIAGMCGMCLGALIGTTGCFLAMMASKTVVTGTNFSDIGWKTMPRAMAAVDFLNLLGNFGILVSLLVIVGDNVPDAMKAIFKTDSFYAGRTFILLLFSLVFLVPTIPASKFEKLSWFSTYAVCTYAYLFCVVVLYATVPSLNSHLEDRVDTDDWYLYPHSTAPVFLSVFPMMLFAFATVQTAVPMVHELKNNTVPRVTLMLFLTFAVASSVFVSVAFCGYHTFGRLTESDILRNYPSNSGPITGVRICLSIAMLFAYAIWLHPTRENLSFLVLKRSIYSAETSRTQYYAVTYGLLALSLAIALATDNLGIVMGLSGAISSTTCILIVPGLLFYYRCTPNGGPLLYSPNPGADRPLLDSAAMPSLVESPQTESPKETGVIAVKKESSFGSKSIGGDTGERENDWNVWPAWMAPFALCYAALGVLLIPLLVTVQFF